MKVTIALASKIVAALVGLAAVAAAFWWAVFALKPYAIPPEQLAARYAHQATPGSRPIDVELGAVQPLEVGSTRAFAAELRFRSFDGVPVTGRIAYPADPSSTAAGQRWPVLLALHGMGRTQWRWWQPEYKGRPTVESTHLLAERALQQGLVVIALDARGHGDRKDPVRPLNVRELMTELEVWGQREPYERMIVDSVRDWRVLLDWVARQPQFDAGRVGAAGYSMGGQMALLLAGADPRVRAVAAMVPPETDDKVALVAPRNAAPRLGTTTVWLLSADKDEYASAQANAALFATLPGPHKRHLTYAAGHRLPERYVDDLRPWLTAVAREPGDQAPPPPTR